MTETDDDAGRVAAKQHGIITRDQARSLGFTSSMIERRRRAGRWVSVERGVYRINGAPETWHSTVLAVCLAFGAVASHRCAAALHRVDGFRPNIIEISLPKGRRVPRPGIVMHESTDLHLFEPEIVDGIPTTPVKRLIVDLGAVVWFERFDRAVDDLIRRKVLTWRTALDQLILHARRGRNGVGALRALLELRYEADVGESVLESAFLRELARRGILEPASQYTVRDADGFIARVDFAYPELRIAIELDGRAFHGDPVFNSDRTKRLRLAAAGWFVVEVTWQMLTGNPDRVFRSLAQIIRDRQAAAA